MVDLYSRILLHDNEGDEVDKCFYMDEPWKLYAKWKKPITKDHILYDDAIYGRYSRVCKSIEIEPWLMIA